VRWLGWVLFIAVVVAWLASEVFQFAPGPPPAPVQQQVRREPVWRRTKTGWETIDFWRNPFTPREPPMHPLVLVAFQIGVSLLALYAIDEPPLVWGAGGDPTGDGSP
jgi:hypothetical protein